MDYSGCAKMTRDVFSVGPAISALSFLQGLADGSGLVNQGRPMSLKQIAIAIGKHLNTARRHIARLERSGIVERRFAVGAACSYKIRLVAIAITAITSTADRSNGS